MFLNNVPFPMIFIFRLFKSFFLVIWISSYFFHILKNSTIFCLLYYGIVFWLFSDRPSVFFFVSALLFFHTLAPILTFFICFFFLFHSCCSYAWVFGKKAACSSSTFPIAMLNDTPFFRHGNDMYSNLVHI